MGIKLPLRDGSIPPPLNLDVPENFAFGGKVSQAARKYGNHPFGKLAAPLPASTGWLAWGGNIQDVSWHPNGQYLAVAYSGTETNEWSLSVFLFTGFAFYRMASTAVRPGANGTTILAGQDAKTVEWSPNGDYLAVGTYGHNKVNVYAFNGTSFTNLTTSFSVDTSIEMEPASDLEWSPDSRFLAVAAGSNPTFSIYRIENTSFTRHIVSEVDVGYQTWFVSWSPDGTHIAVAYEHYPYFLVYKFDGKSLTRLPDPEESLPGGVLSLAWSPDGKHLAVSHVFGNLYTVYRFEDGKLIKLPEFFNRPVPDWSGTPNGDQLKWSPDGRYLLCTRYPADSVCIDLFYFTGETFFKVPNPKKLTITDARGIGWTTDQKYLTLGANTYLFAPGHGEPGSMLELSTIKSSPF